MGDVHIMGNSLQQLGAYSNQPQSNPEDQYLQDLAAQSAQRGFNPILQYGMPQAQGLQGPSEGKVGFLQGQYNDLYQASQGGKEHGLGALASGIGSMILAPQVRKVEQQAEANRIREADVHLKGLELDNKAKEYSLKQTKGSLDLAAANQAYGAVQNGDMNPETMKQAGVKLKADGSIYSNMDYFNDAVISGKMPYNMASLIPHNAALITEMQKPHSSLTQKDFESMLAAASKEKDAYDKELIQAQKGRFKDQYEGLKVMGNLLENGQKMMTSFTDPKVLEMGGPVIKQMMMETLTPMLLGIKKAGKMANVKGIDDISVQELNDAGDAAFGTEANGYKQDGRPLIKIFEKLRNISAEGEMLQQKPKDSPDRVKTTKAPIPVGTNAAPPKTTPPPKVDVFDVP